MKYCQKILFVLGLNVLCQNIGFVSGPTHENESLTQPLRPYLSAHLQRIENFSPRVKSVVSDPELDYIKVKKQNDASSNVSSTSDDRLTDIDAEMADLIEMMQNMPIKKRVPSGTKRTGDELIQSVDAANKNLKRQKL